MKRKRLVACVLSMLMVMNSTFTPIHAFAETGDGGAFSAEVDTSADASDHTSEGNTVDTSGDPAGEENTADTSEDSAGEKNDEAAGGDTGNGNSDKTTGDHTGTAGDTSGSTTGDIGKDQNENIDGDITVDDGSQSGETTATEKREPSADDSQSSQPENEITMSDDTTTLPADDITASQGGSGSSSSGSTPAGSTDYESAETNHEYTVEVYTDPDVAELGETVKFIAEVHGIDADLLHYQWQYSPDGEDWRDIEGATSDEYVVKATMHVFLHYYRVVTSLNDEAVTEKIPVETTEDSSDDASLTDIEIRIEPETPDDQTEIKEESLVTIEEIAPEETESAETEIEKENPEDAARESSDEESTSILDTLKDILHVGLNTLKETIFMTSYAAADSMVTETATSSDAASDGSGLYIIHYSSDAVTSEPMMLTMGVRRSNSKARSAGSQKIYWNPDSKKTYDETGDVIVAAGNDDYENCGLTPQTPVNTLGRLTEVVNDYVETCDVVVYCMNPYDVQDTQEFFSTDSTDYGTTVTICDYDESAIDNTTMDPGAKHTGFFFNVLEGSTLTLSNLTISGENSKIELNGGTLTLGKNLCIDEAITLSAPSDSNFPIVFTEDTGSNAATESSGKYLINFDGNSDMELIAIAEGEHIDKLQLAGTLNQNWSLCLKDGNTYVKNTPLYEAIYISGDSTKGSDDNLGNSPDQPISTFKRAKELLEEQNERELENKVDTIYVLDTVNVSSEDTEYLTAIGEIEDISPVIRRYDESVGTLLEIEDGVDCTINISLYGNRSSESGSNSSSNSDSDSNAPLIEVCGGTLRLVSGAKLYDNAGDAILMESGKLTVEDGVIIGGTSDPEKVFGWGINATGGELEIRGESNAESGESSTESDENGTESEKSSTGLSITGTGGVYVGQGVSLLIHGAKLLTNSYDADHPALYLAGGSEYTISGNNTFQCTGNSVYGYSMVLSGTEPLTLDEYTAISGKIKVAESAQLTLSLSPAKISEIDNEGSITINNGTTAANDTVNVNSGSVNTLNATKNGTVNINSGSVNILNTFNDAVINIFGGTVNNLTMWDSSKVTILDPESDTGTDKAFIREALVESPNAVLTANGGRLNYTKLKGDANGNASTLYTNGKAELGSVILGHEKAVIELSGKLEQETAIELTIENGEAEGRLVVRGSGYNASDDINKFKLSSSAIYALAKDNSDIILRVEGIFVNTGLSDDLVKDNNGLTRETPVNTFSRAAALLTSKLDSDPNFLPYIIVLDEKQPSFDENSKGQSRATVRTGDSLIIDSKYHNVKVIPYYTSGSKMLTDEEQAPLITVAKGDSFTISNVTIYERNQTSSQRKVLIDVEGNLTVDGGSVIITDNKGIQVEESGTLNLVDGTIRSNRDSGNIGIYVKGGTVYIGEGGTLTNLTYGVYELAGSVYMNGGTNENGTITNCRYNGAYVSGGSFTMNGGKITDNGTSAKTSDDDENKVEVRGGGVYIGKTAQFHVTADSEISDNNATYGGGIYWDCPGKDSSNMVVDKILTLSGNEAMEGGGLYIYNLTETEPQTETQTETETDTEAATETATETKTHTHTHTLQNYTITGNTAVNGGGIYDNCAGELTLGDCTLTDNQARGTNGCGGAVYAKQGRVILDVDVNSGNTGNQGSAIYLESGATLVHQSGTIYGSVYASGQYQMNVSEDVYVTDGIDLKNINHPLELTGEITYETSRNIKIRADGFETKTIVQGSAETVKALDWFVITGVAYTKDTTTNYNIVGDTTNDVYWDPANASDIISNDNNSGNAPANAVRTFQCAMEKLASRPSGSRIIVCSTCVTPDGQTKYDQTFCGKFDENSDESQKATLIRGQALDENGGLVPLIGNMFSFTTKGMDVTFCDIIISGDYPKSMTQSNTPTGSLIYVDGNTAKASITVTLSNVELKNNKMATESSNTYGGAVYAIGSNTKIEINGNSSIHGCKAGYGGAIAAQSATVTIKNSVESETDTESGTGLNIYDCEAYQGGAIYSYQSYCTVENHVNIYQNKAQDGGGIWHSAGEAYWYSAKKGSLNISNINVYANQAIDSKGSITNCASAIGIYYGDALISNCNIGDIAAESASASGSENSNINENAGGTITHIGAGTLTITGCQITGNTGITAGGIYSDGFERVSRDEYQSSGNVILDNNIINYNYASNNKYCAGGIYAIATNLTLKEGNTFTGNNGYVGAIYIGFNKKLIDAQWRNFDSSLNMSDENKRTLIIKDNISNYQMYLDSTTSTTSTQFYNLTVEFKQQDTDEDSHGGIYSETPLEINTGRVSGHCKGIGIYSKSNLTLTQVTVTNNGTGIKTENASLTVKKCEITYNKKIYNKKTLEMYGGGISANNSSVTVEGGKISGNEAYYSGGGIYANNSSSVTVSNVTISKNSAPSGGGIYANNTPVIVTGGKISRNEATNGGGIYADNRSADNSFSVTVNGGTISKNKATNNGGGIYLYALYSVTVTGGTISKNKATNGGGIYADKGYADNDSAVTVKNVTISKNSAVDGGGIYANSNVTISGGMIWKNEATENGGGIYSTYYLYTQSGNDYQVQKMITLSGGTVTANTAGMKGGGIYSNSDAVLSGGTVTANKAAYGGGIYAVSSVEDTLTLNGGTISGNTTSADDDWSSGIYNEGRELLMAGSSVNITDNIYLNHKDYPIQLTKTMNKSVNYRIALNMNSSDANRYKYGNVVVMSGNTDTLPSVSGYLQYTLPVNDGAVFTKGDKTIILKRCVFVGGSQTGNGSTPDKAFATMKEALNAASDGNSVIYVCGLVKVDSGEVWESAKDVELRRYTGFAVGGKSAYPEYKGTMFRVSKGSTLTLGSGISLIAGRYSEEDTITPEGSIFEVEGTLAFGAPMTLEGNLTSGTDGGAIQIASGGAVVINDNVEIKEMSADNGGGIYNAGTLTVSEGKALTIYNTTASRYGSAVYQTSLSDAGDTFVLEDGSSLLTDGTVYLTGGTDLTLGNDVTFTEPLSLDIGDPYSGRIYVKYTSLEDSDENANAQSVRFSLPKRITTSYILSHTASPEDNLELVLYQNNIVYVDPDYDAGWNNGDVKGAYAGYPFNNLYDAYAQLLGEGGKGGLIYIVHPIEINGNVTVGNHGYKDGIPEHEITNDAYSVSIKRYSRPESYTGNGADYFAEAIAPTNEESLFVVETDGTLTLDGITLDGHANAVTGSTEETKYTIAPAVAADAPLVTVKLNGNLVLTGGTLLNNNSNTKDDTSKTNSQKADTIWNNGSVTIAGEATLDGTLGLADNRFITVTGENKISVMDVLLNSTGVHSGRVIAQYCDITEADSDQVGAYQLEDTVLENYKLVIDETNKNQIILQARGLAYVNGEIETDEGNTGNTPNSPFKTLKKAYEKLKDGGGTIYIVGTVNVTDSVELLENMYIEGTDTSRIQNNGTVRILRYSKPTDETVMASDGYKDSESFTGAMFDVGSLATMVLEDIVIDGHGEAMDTGNELTTSETVVSAAPMFHVHGTLRIMDDAVLQNNKNNSGNANRSSGGAIRIYPAGIVEMYGGRICDNEDADGITGIMDYGILKLGYSADIREQEVYLGSGMNGNKDNDKSITIVNPLTTMTSDDMIKVDFDTDGYRDGRVIAIFADGLTADTSLFDLKEANTLMIQRNLFKIANGQKVELQAPFQITYKLKNLDLAKDSPMMIGSGMELSTGIIGHGAYRLPKEIMVKVMDKEGKEITLNPESTDADGTLTGDYTYDPETGSIRVKGSCITGPVTIIAEGFIQIDVTVPMYVCMYAYGGDGRVVTPEDGSYAITNNSTCDVQVTKVSVLNLNDNSWILKNSATDLKAKELYLKLKDHVVTEGASELNPGWVIPMADDSGSGRNVMTLPISAAIAGNSVNADAHERVCTVQYTVEPILE